MFDRSLRGLLDGEMEHSAGLRQETELLKKKLAEQEDRHEAKVQALTRLEPTTFTLTNSLNTIHINPL